MNRLLIKPSSIQLAFKFLWLLVFVFNPAQAENVVEDAGSWLQIMGEGSLKFIDPSLEKGRLWMEGQSRWDDNWQHWYQGLLRIGLGYGLSDRATVWLGYTYLATQILERVLKATARPDCCVARCSQSSCITYTLRLLRAVRLALGPLVTLLKHALRQALLPATGCVAGVSLCAAYGCWNFLFPHDV